MPDVDGTPEVVTRMWASIKGGNWDVLRSCLATDFVRTGADGGDGDVCAGADDYVDYMSTVVSRWQSFEMEVLRSVSDPQARTVVVEVRESMAPPGGHAVTLHFVAVHDLDEHGLIRRLDLFQKRPTGTLPSWAAPGERNG